MAKKYLKNENGIVKAITTNNLGLEKPMLNENYDIDVHNRNMDKIDSAIQEVKGKVDGLELTAERVSIADSTNKFEATNVEDALLENKTSILNNAELANQALTKANEAFQRGDNVKTQLVDKLISEGLEVSTNNTFEELIGNIALGKKWASGTASSTATATDTFYLVGGGTAKCKYFDILNLSFIPNHIIFLGKKSSTASGYLTNLESTNLVDGISYINYCSTYRSDSGHTVSTIGFSTKSNIFKEDRIRIPCSMSSNTSVEISWIAFE